jgi:geranylgeranyl diphosphate synthase type 3
MDVPTGPLKIIVNSINMLHSASLLIDDVQDNSTLRRGVPVAHSIYGVAQTINSANYFYFCAMKELQKLESSEVMTHFALLQLHRGQGMDLHWRDSLICPTEVEYLKMISNKMGVSSGLASS